MHFDCDTDGYRAFVLVKKIISLDSVCYRDNFSNLLGAAHLNPVMTFVVHSSN